MKIAFVAAQDPSTAIRFFSGIPYHLYRALADQAEVFPLAVTVTGPPAWWHYYARLVGKVTGQQSRWGMRPSVLQELAAKTAEQAARNEVDVVLTVGQGYLVYWASSLPAASFSDLLYGSVAEEGFREQSETPRRLNREQQQVMKRYAQQAVDNAAHVFVTSDFVLEGARRYGTKIPADKVTVTQMGANFDEKPLPGGPRKAPPPVRLLWMGTAWEGKGGPEALAVLDGLVERGVAAELHLVGRMPDKLTHPNVACHGFLRKDVPQERAKLMDLYRQSHLLLLPTRKDLTPSGLAEAAAFGVPAVTTPVGGIPGMFGEDEVVLLPFERYQTEASELIMALLENGRLPIMAEKVRRRFETALNWEVIARKILSKLDEVLGF